MRARRGANAMLMNKSGVAIGHAAHAQHDVRGGGGHGAQQAGCEPVEMQVEWKQGMMTDAGKFTSQRPAGAKRQQRRRVAGRGEGARQEDRLPLGAAAAQVVLEDEDFH